MESVILKAAFIGVKIISFPILVMYCLFYEKRTLIEVLHDDSVQTSLDVLAISFYAYATYLKVSFGVVSVHSICESMFFYGGGFLTLCWGIYRVLHERENYKTKKAVNKFQEDVFKEASKK